MSIVDSTMLIDPKPSERPKWMPDDDKIRACAAVDHVGSAHTKLYLVHSTMTLMHATGLRAQIAKLKQFAPVIAMLDFDRQRNAGLHALCTSIEEEIAALRKELGE